MIHIKIFVEKDYDALSQRAASIIAAQIQKKPDSVLGLATGSTPLGTYEKLVAQHKSGRLDFGQISAFNLDEYYPIKKGNDQSYFYFMHENLFRHVNVNPARLSIPSGEAADSNAECMAYEKKIANAGGIDLQLLGLGLNGHIGFNEPCDKFMEITHLVDLDESTIEANARFFESADEVPRKALTMGIGTIMQSREVLLLISGAKKAEIAKQVLFGDITPQVPGSALRFHHNVTVVLDEEAGRLVAPLT